MDTTMVILFAPDGPDRDKLVEEHANLSEKMQDLIDKSIMEGTVEYDAAIAALEAASEMLDVAKADVNKIVGVIEKIAKAAKVVGELVSTLA